MRSKIIRIIILIIGTATVASNKIKPVAPMAFLIKTLLDKMNEIYSEYGCYLHRQLSFAYEGQSGMETMNEIMTSLRNEPPKTIGGYNVTVVNDYLTSKSTCIKCGEVKEITLPKSNVIGFELDGGNSVIVRPSGTEPKIKVYLSAVGESADATSAICDKLAADMTEITKK